MLISTKYCFMDYHDIITIEPGKRSGKPCIRGMRITVYDILEYLAGGMTETEILEDFSELTSADIKACLAFAADREKKLFVASLWNRYSTKTSQIQYYNIIETVLPSLLIQLELLRQPLPSDV